MCNYYPVRIKKTHILTKKKLKLLKLDRLNRNFQLLSMKKPRFKQRNQLIAPAAIFEKIS